MLSKIFGKGVTTAIVLLFIGLVFSPSINANVGKPEVVVTKDTLPLELQYQQIIDKIKSINIQMFLFEIDAVVKTLEEISITLEDNDDLKLYAQMQSDCGCEGTTKWPFPVICTLLLPFWFLSFWIWSYTRKSDPIFLGIMYTIGEPLNCFWVW